MEKFAHFEKFTISEEITSAGLRWKSYIARFKNMLKAFKIDDEEQKIALLLHNAGEEVFEIYQTLPTTSSTTFDAVSDLLTGYFCPKKCMEFEVHKFRKSYQMKDESMDAFHTRLRKLATCCDFHDSDKEIKMQIIEGCRSHQLRVKALQDSPTLDALLAQARSMEISVAQANEMEHKEVCKMYTNKEKRNKYCYRCGGEFPHNGSCPAIGKKCDFCKQMNHFSSVCRKKKSRNNSIKSTEINETIASDSDDAESETEYV